MRSYVTAQAPTVTISPALYVFCSGMTQTFTATSSDTAVTYSWSVAPARAASIISRSDSASALVKLDLPVIFTVSVKVTNAAGTGSAAVTFSVTRGARAAFNASLDATGYPANLILTNYSSNSVSYRWSYSNNNEPDTTANVEKPYSAAGTYTVTLTAFGRNNCHDVQSYVFEIPESSSLVLPTIFTPNNDDVNEIYRPIAIGIRTLKATVFNRWGLILSTWDRVNGFWDGRTTSGEECSEGQYFIAVEATGFDEKTYKMKTGFTLAR